MATNGGIWATAGVILEGEGLANDATALILYRFAVMAVSSGVFSFGQAAGMFAAILTGEILWGIGVGWLMLRLRRWVRDPRIEITLSILTPFAAYWPPQHLGGSGVLATVTAGLYISWNGLRLINAATEPDLETSPAQRDEIVVEQVSFDHSILPYHI